MLHRIDSPYNFQVGSKRTTDAIKYKERYDQEVREKHSLSVPRERTSVPRSGCQSDLTVMTANVDYPPTRWPQSPRFVVQCTSPASRWP